ncbi:MAG: DUF58 domain-containing protein, partial [Verrucomicrobiota bacterium]
SPEALMKIRHLEWRARSVVEGFWTGLHRSPYHGFSAEFTEYRAYTPGDDLRHVDWRVFGRNDRHVIRKFEEETNLRCLLLVDQSRSMAYGSTGHTKADYAATLAATLARFLHQQGDAVGLLSFDQRVRDYLPPRHRTSHLRQITLALEKPAGGTATDLVSPLRRVGELVRQRGRVVMISDFLAPLEALDRVLGQLVAAGQEVTLFRVLDPREIAFDFKTATLFEDVETGRTLHIDPDAVRQEYIDRFRAHAEALNGLARRLGIACHTVPTTQPLETLLLDVLRSRSSGPARHRSASAIGR